MLCKYSQRLSVAREVDESVDRRDANNVAAVLMQREGRQVFFWSNFHPVPDFFGGKTSPLDGQYLFYPQ